MQKHTLLTLLGLILAALAVAWIEPNTNGGTTFVVAVSVLLANAIGGMVIRLRKKQKDMPKPRVAAAAASGATKTKATKK